MVEMTECLKSWVATSSRRQQAPLGGVFRNNHFIDEAIEHMQKSGEIVDIEEALGT
jgi:hypothetical protein